MKVLDCPPRTQVSAALIQRYVWGPTPVHCLASKVEAAYVVTAKTQVHDRLNHKGAKVAKCLVR